MNSEIELGDVQKMHSEDGEILLEENKQKKQCRFIDIQVISAKISYFMYYAAVGAWWPYMMLFLTSLGLSPFLSGLIICLRTAVSSFAAPFWGFITDYTKKRKITLTLLCVGMAVTLLPAIGVFLDRSILVFV